MASEEVSVIALVENLELAVPRRLPSRLLQPTTSRRQENSRESEKTPRVAETIKEPKTIQPKNVGDLGRIVEQVTILRGSKGIGKQLDFAGDIKTLKSDLPLDAVKVEKSSAATTIKSLESLEILRRLPPGTVLIKQVEEKKPHRRVEERLAIKASAKTSHETDVDERPRKTSQRVRNKKTLEVRRNPLRTASRKELPIKATTSRQRLLTGGIRRRGSSAANSTSERNTAMTKRSRNAAPYITTRSVTRKLGNVGATYEAPTRRDELEWKEWPVHGMHERPVYHPQFGLAAEYNGRFFASFDGEAYREIPTEPAIEIVRVDPRVERLDLHCRVNNLTSARPQLQQSLTSASPATPQIMNATVSRYGRPRLPTAGYAVQMSGRTIGLEQLHTAYSLTHRQPQTQLPHLEQLRNQLESMQRMQQNTRLRMQQSSKTYSQQNLSSSRLISQEMYRNIQQQQQNITSRCLMVTPRADGQNVATPLAIPFCGVPATFKGNSKGQLFFVRASDAATTKPIPERTTTITSSTQSFNNSTNDSSSWNESSLRKIFESNVSSSTSTSRIYSGIPVINRPLRFAQTSRGFPAEPPLNAEQTTARIYRANLQKAIGLREDPNLKLSENMSAEDHMAEVLDLSNKVQRGAEELKGERKTDSQVYSTDLVHYFQNFNADESMDMSEEPKRLS